MEGDLKREKVEGSCVFIRGRRVEREAFKWQKKRDRSTRQHSKDKGQRQDTGVGTIFVKKEKYFFLK